MNEKNDSRLDSGQRYFSPIRVRPGAGLYIVFLLLGFSAFAAIEALPNMPYEQLKIVRTFPSEEQVNKFDYVLDKGHFLINGSTIVFCAQFQHRIFIIDKYGNLIKTIGRKGQGPLEFSFPYSIYYYQDDLYVTDNRNARIQVIGPEGECKKVIKLPDQLGGLWISDGNIILYKSSSRMIRGKNGGFPLIGIYDLDGKLKRNIYTEFKSSYGEFSKDNDVSIRLINKQLHCLQKFGTTYRIFDLNGHVIREFTLQYDPLKDIEHQKTEYYYTYKTFCSDGKKIYAPVDLLGKICICVFDMNGRLLKRYENPQENPKDVYDVMDVAIEAESGKEYLYIFLMTPEDKFYLAEIDPQDIRETTKNIVMGMQDGYMKNKVLPGIAGDFSLNNHGV